MLNFHATNQKLNACEKWQEEIKEVFFLSHPPSLDQPPPPLRGALPNRHHGRRPCFVAQAAGLSLSRLGGRDWRGINREKLGIPIQPINPSTHQPISQYGYGLRVTTAFRKRCPCPLGETGAFPRAEGVSQVDQFENQVTTNRFIIQLINQSIN